MMMTTHAAKQIMLARVVTSLVSFRPVCCFPFGLFLTSFCKSGDEEVVFVLVKLCGGKLSLVKQGFGRMI